MHIFIGGIMQGSREDHLIGDQDYRGRIMESIEKNIPGAIVSDPFTLHPESVDYDPDKVRETFGSLTSLAAEADVLIAYLPTASMGTAIEMWSAHNAGKYVVVVTPLKHNWVVRYTADEILPDLDSLLKTIETGRLAQRLTNP